MATKILLADDSLTIRKVVELTFSDTDMHVSSVASGEEALSTFKDIQPDLVLADVVMPEVNGYDVCQQIKSSDNPVPVLLLAGTFEPFDDQLAKNCGADGHLIKPFESHALIEKVEQLLDEAKARKEAEAAAEAARLKEEEERKEREALEAQRAKEAQEVEAAREREEAERKAADLKAANERRLAAEQAERAESARREQAEAHTESPKVSNFADHKSEMPRRIPVQTADESTSTQNSSGLSDEDVQRISKAVVQHLSEGVLREIAWDVVPELANRIIRERLEQLERDADPRNDAG